MVLALDDPGSWMDVHSGQTYQMCELEQLIHPFFHKHLWNTHPGIQQRTPCPQVANSPVKERKVNDYSVQWESMGASGTMRRTSSWVRVGGGGTQGELEEKGRVFQVKKLWWCWERWANQSRVSWLVLNSSALSRAVPTLQESCENWLIQ